MDYKKLGLKCGLEIHQQINTGKLFCACPSNIRDDKTHFSVQRKLRASAGESGKIDQAAAAEKKKQKYFEYEGYHDTTCLVELDEEPPHAMNAQALAVTLQVCKMLGSDVVDQIRVMRKTVIDGSNTSGFQRTSLIGIGGKLSEVGIEAICLEEDAAKIVERTGTKDIYNLSRLGIPLIELATAPEIKTPEQAKEVAAEIGMILRSTGLVKRGIGTIRQDLNVSIAQGVRVELKGVQELRLIPTYVEYEVKRQKNLLDIYAELKTKKARAEKKVYDITTLFTETQGKVVRGALKKKNGSVLAIKLPGYEGFLGRETQPGRRVGSELSDHAKTQGVQGLFHSDELPAYGITETEVQAIKKELQIKKEDAFILIASNKEIAQRALEAVISAANKLQLEKEVRQAKPDGTSQYMRPMPGAARMYPETDVPAINTPNLDAIKTPELISDKTTRFEQEYSLSKDLAGQLAKEGYDFDTYVKKYSQVKATNIAEILISVPKELKKRFKIEYDAQTYACAVTEILKKLNTGAIQSQAVVNILVAMNKGPVDWKKFKPVDDGDLDAVLQKVIDADPKAPLGALMGAAMKALGGKADGKIVMNKLKELTKK